MKRRRIAPFIAAAVGLVLLFVVVIAANSKSANERIPDSPLLAKPAPALTGELLLGESVTLDELRGQYVVVNFFATWCIPCREEHPELVRFASRHAQEGDASVIQVVYGDRSSNVKAFIEKNGGDWPVFDDPEGTMALDWGVRGLPESYVIDPTGIVRAKVTGGATADNLDGLLRRLRGSG